MKQADHGGCKILHMKELASKHLAVRQLPFFEKAKMPCQTMWFNFEGGLNLSVEPAIQAVRYVGCFSVDAKELIKWLHNRLPSWSNQVSAFLGLETNELPLLTLWACIAFLSDCTNVFFFFIMNKHVERFLFFFLGKDVIGLSMAIREFVDSRLHLCSFIYVRYVLYASPFLAKAKPYVNASFDIWKPRSLSTVEKPLL